MQILSPYGALALILIYAISITAFITWASRRASATKLGFLVADRDIGRTAGALSTANAWIWAPALFLSAEKAYTQGWVGLFWFLFGNTLCLILFAFFAIRIRDQLPNGFTGAGYMRERHSQRVHALYLMAHGGLTVCSFAVQLLAGGLFFSAISGAPYVWVTIVLALVPVYYTMLRGTKGSIAGDVVQLTILSAIGAILIPWTILNAGGMETLAKGLYGVTGTYTDLWSGDGWNVFLTFGLAATIGLLAGPFGDQSFWQRAFAIRRNDVRPAFLIAPVIFATVAIGIGLLGFLAAGLGMQTSNPTRINVEVVAAYLPWAAVVAFAILILAGLSSKLDTNLAAFSSLGGHDVARLTEKESDRRSIYFGRAAMALLVLAGIGIANIPGIRLEYLFLTYGTLRTATFLPTVITIVNKDVSEAGMFWGILSSLIVGWPMFAYGLLTKTLWLSITGTLVTLLASGIIVRLASDLRR